MEVRRRKCRSFAMAFIWLFFFYNLQDGSVCPVLIIGHHILNGKIQNLERPLAILERKTIVGDRTLEFVVKTVITKKISFKTRPKPIIVGE